MRSAALQTCSGNMVGEQEKALLQLGAGAGGVGQELGNLDTASIGEDTGGA